MNFMVVEPVTESDVGIDFVDWDTMGYLCPSKTDLKNPCLNLMLRRLERVRFILIRRTFDVFTYTYGIQDMNRSVERFRRDVFL